MTLTEFLLARIAEDEAAARKPEGWIQSTDLFSTRAADHRDWWGPARVLVACESKRVIVEGHAPWHVCPNISNRGGQDFEGDEIDLAPCPTLKLLALPYADHPDYQPEWRQ